MGKRPGPGRRGCLAACSAPWFHRPGRPRASIPENDEPIFMHAPRLLTMKLPTIRTAACHLQTVVRRTVGELCAYACKQKRPAAAAFNVRSNAISSVRAAAACRICPRGRGIHHRAFSCMRRTLPDPCNRTGRPSASAFALNSSVLITCLTALANVSITALGVFLGMEKPRAEPLVKLYPSSLNVECRA